MRYNAVIVDDETDGRIILSKRVADWVPQVKIVGTYATPAEAMEGIAAHKPDILFLDIEMPQMNGFELYHHLSHHGIDAQCIIVTAYSKHEYYIKAFVDLQVAGYVLKPLAKEKLKEAVDVAVVRLLAAARNKNGKVAFDTTIGVLYIKLEQILYIKSSAKYCEAYLTNGTKEIVMNGISEMEQSLANTALVRIDRYTIVNKQHILYSLDRGYKVKFSLPTGIVEIEISKEGKDRLDKILKEDQI